jgi:hypothetical protein
MRTKRESFLFWGPCLPFWENGINVHYLGGFCVFLDNLKRWMYVLKVLELDGKLCFAKFRQEMAEIALFGDFTKPALKLHQGPHSFW